MQYLIDRGLPHLDTDVHRAIPEGIDIEDEAYGPMCDAVSNLYAKLFDWIGVAGAYYRITQGSLQAHLAQSRQSPVTAGPEPHPSFTTVAHPLGRFHIDDSALRQWINTAEKGPEDFLVTSTSEYPASDFAQMVKNASEFGVIVDVRGLDLEVISSDSDEGPPGYYVMLRNTRGDQRQIFLTTGYNELEVPPRRDERAEPVFDRARRYLELVCQVSNTLIDSI